MPKMALTGHGLTVTTCVTSVLIHSHHPSRSNQHNPGGNMRKLATALAAGTLLLLTALPVHAAQSASTNVTFTLQSGGLSISAPASAPLGTFAFPRTSVSGALGTTTVDDQRGSTSGSWG